MEVLEHGFRFFTIHNADGNVAHVEGHYEREQTQAPIRRTQKFEMDFFGRGAGMVLGVHAPPRRHPRMARPSHATITRRSPGCSSRAGPGRADIRASLANYP